MRCSTMFRCDENPDSSVSLEFVLAQMVNSERLPAFSQDLLLLLPLSLFLAPFVVTLFW